MMKVFFNIHVGADLRVCPDAMEDTMYDPDRHYRHTFRLKDFNYSSNDMYFVTIVAQDRQCILGEISCGKLTLSHTGIMADKWINELPNKYPGILLDKYVVMPSHIHFVIIHVGADLCVCPDKEKEYIAPQLSQIIQWFKTMTTNEYIKGVKSGDYSPFDKRVWQRNYHEHIIKNYTELRAIQNYIKYNPIHWDNDKCNPQYGPYLAENTDDWANA